MRIVLGVGGGIAAYKAAALASALVQRGHEVQVAMTSAATQFVGPLTFEGLTHRPVAVAFDDRPMGALSHVRVAAWAEALLIAPLPAELLARLAQGTGSDFLSLVYLGFRGGPVILAPAMEAEMWSHPATVRNRGWLEADGAHFVGPETGRLASGAMGAGRMASPERLLDHLEWQTSEKVLAGKRVVVTTGPTWEFFDPVRLMTNPSTGTMGWEVARVARNQGATVTLIRGPGADCPELEGVETVRVTSATEMAGAVADRFSQCDVLVGAAAVSDFRPRHTASVKVHKNALAGAWEMEANPDILGTWGPRKTHQVVVGFAAETDEVVHSAADKLAGKALDLVVANPVGHGRGFGSGATTVYFVGADGVLAEWIGVDKSIVAEHLWETVRQLPRWPGRDGG